MPEDNLGTERGRATTHGNASTGELFLDFLKAARIPLIVGFLCATGIVALVVTDVQWRSLSLVALTSLLALPYVTVYGLLFAWHVRRRQGEIVVVRDEDHEELGVMVLSPDEWAASEIDGNLTDRRGKFTGRTVHVCEGIDWEQREEVDRDDGTISVEAQRVLRGTWEFELGYQRFVEDRAELTAWKDRIVPLAKAGQKERAARNVRVLETTDRMGHGLIKGAEEDAFLVDDLDPFGYDPLDEDAAPDFLDSEEHIEDDADDDADEVELADLFESTNQGDTDG